MGAIATRLRHSSRAVKVFRGTFSQNPEGITQLDNIQAASETDCTNACLEGDSGCNVVVYDGKTGSCTLAAAGPGAVITLDGAKSVVKSKEQVQKEQGKKEEAKTTTKSPEQEKAEVEKKAEKEEKHEEEKMEKET